MPSAMQAERERERERDRERERERLANYIIIKLLCKVQKYAVERFFTNS
jgi:hypothetical protein